jgi:hypothetical protein
MASNTDIEMRWIEAWNQAHEIAGDHKQDIPCELPDGTAVGFQDCLGWLQDSVYGGCFVHVAAGWVRGRRGIVVRRSPGHDAASRKSPGA